MGTGQFPLHILFENCTFIAPSPNCYIAHGVEGSIELGYGNYFAKNQLSFSTSHISRLFADSFDNPNSCFYSCNTGTGESSFAQMWVNKTNGITWAVRGKTSYYNIFDYMLKYDGFYKYGSDNYPDAGESSYWKTFKSSVSIKNW